MIKGHYDILFTPLKIGPVTAPNRFVMMPYANGHSYLMPNGAIGIRELRAEGGWGIIGMQLSEIDPTSDLSGLPYDRNHHNTRTKSAGPGNPVRGVSSGPK